LPQALAELRCHHPEWLPCLAGRAPSVPTDTSSESISPRPHRAPEPIRSRGEVGAAVLCVFRFEPGRGAFAVIADVAPALRAALEAWLPDREDAWSVPSEHEHRLVVSARALRIHAESESAIAGVLGREATRALILAPVLDGDGEVGGWLHMEFEHHLAPSAARTRMLAETWSAELARAAARAESSAESPVTAHPPDDLCAAVFERTVLELGIKTSQRRWWGFNLEADATREVSCGGEGSLDLERRGEQRALRRAVMTGGTVVFDEPSDRLAVSADAGSGVALPLLAAKRVYGALVLESTRRHDFRDGDVERYGHVLGRAGLALRLAQFRTWHRTAFGFDLWFDAARVDFQSFARHVLVAARSRAPVVMFGAAGTGKLVFTRWLHFESEGCKGPIKVFSCALGASRGRLAGMLDDARDGTLVLDDVDALDPSLQEELLRWLEGVDAAGASALCEESQAAAHDVDDECASSPRILATTRVGLVEAARAGALRADLALRLNRLQLRVPALKERREDIVPLVHCLARRFAEEEAIALPSFTDEALALLWRQPWDGNVRELENVVYKLVLLNAAEGTAAQPIDIELVTRVARQFELDLARKLNSRHPLRSDLMAALRETRMGAGRINKTKAAQYLGWDPDTLVARMQDLGIEDEGDLGPSAWSDEPSKTGLHEPSS
jgi:transcriptional regulator with AAA-type ATPase domain